MADQTNPAAAVADNTGADTDSGQASRGDGSGGTGQAGGQAAPPNQDGSGPSPQRHKRSGGLSVTKVAGGALAAMVTAAFGSRLGVAGTVGGAALVSACLAVLDSVFTASLQHTQRGVQKVARTVGPAAQNRLTGTMRHPGTGNRPASDTARNHAGATEQKPASDRRQAATRGLHSRRRRVITGALAGAGVVFVVTLGAIFGVELVTGHSFNGQHQGTTIGQAVRGQNWTQSSRGGSHPENFQDKDGNIQQPNNSHNHGNNGDNQGGDNGGDKGQQDNKPGDNGKQGNSGDNNGQGQQGDNGGNEGQGQQGDGGDKQGDNGGNKGQQDNKPGDNGGNNDGG